MTRRKHTYRTIDEAMAVGFRMPLADYFHLKDAEPYVSSIVAGRDVDGDLTISLWFEQRPPRAIETSLREIGFDGHLSSSGDGRWFLWKDYPQTRMNPAPAPPLHEDFYAEGVVARGRDGRMYRLTWHGGGSDYTLDYEPGYDEARVRVGRASLVKPFRTDEKHWMVWRGKPAVFVADADANVFSGDDDALRELGPGNCMVAQAMWARMREILGGAR